MKEYLKKDLSYKSGRILGSMCTQPHPEAVQIFSKYIDKNLGDPALFPGTAEIERLFIKKIGKMSLTVPLEHLLCTKDMRTFGKIYNF